MPITTTLLKSAIGVSLTQIEDPSAPMTSQYSLTTDRTTEPLFFDDLAAAHKAYIAEVSASLRTPATLKKSVLRLMSARRSPRG